MSTFIIWWTLCGAIGYAGFTWMDGWEFNDFGDFYIGRYLDMEGKILRAVVTGFGPVGLIALFFIFVEQRHLLGFKRDAERVAEVASGSTPSAVFK